jgi:hypothetical protein
MQSAALRRHRDEVSCRPLPGSMPDAVAKPASRLPAARLLRDPARRERPALPAARGRAGARAAPHPGHEPERAGARDRCRPAVGQLQLRRAAQPGLDDEGAHHLRGARVARARLYLADARLCRRARARPRAGRSLDPRGRRRSVHDGGSLVGIRQRAAPAGDQPGHRRRRDRQQLLRPPGRRPGRVRQPSASQLQRAAGRADGEFPDRERQRRAGRRRGRGAGARQPVAGEHDRGKLGPARERAVPSRHRRRGRRHAGRAVRQPAWPRRALTPRAAARCPSRAR